MADTKAQQKFTFSSFLARWLLSVALVFCTYNPTGYSFVGWLQSGMTEKNLGPEHFVVGVLLLIGWGLFVNSTIKALDTIGLILISAFLGCGPLAILKLGSLDDWIFRTY